MEYLEKEQLFAKADAIRWAGPVTRHIVYSWRLLRAHRQYSWGPGATAKPSRALSVLGTPLQAGARR